MDPVSVLFSVYLNSVIENKDVKPADAEAEPQALVITYEKIEIPFQYQAWSILDSSVCDRYGKNLSKLSECSLKAKTMFRSLCSELEKQATESEHLINTKKMYCGAAESYKPRTASISVSGAGSDELKRAKQDCNAAVVEAMGRNNTALDVHRGEACKRYKELLDKEYGP